MYNDGIEAHRLSCDVVLEQSSYLPSLPVCGGLGGFEAVPPRRPGPSHYKAHSMPPTALELRNLHAPWPFAPPEHCFRYGYGFTAGLGLSPYSRYVAPFTARVLAAFGYIHH